MALVAVFLVTGAAIEPELEPRIICWRPSSRTSKRCPRDLVRFRGLYLTVFFFISRCYALEKLIVQESIPYNIYGATANLRNLQNKRFFIKYAMTR